jgi:hypothetical protein
MSYKNIFFHIINIFFIFCIVYLVYQLFIIKKKPIENFSEKDDGKFFNDSDNKYVCVYAYYEKNDEYKENLDYFLTKGGIQDGIDYYIVINGECTVDIPDKSNIKVIYRENKGFDFGGWQHAIKKYIKKQYDYYIFLNSSVRGPYPENKPWLEYFLPLFTSSKDVKLVGTTINIFDSEFWVDMKPIYEKDGPYSHVQSMFFILNREGFDYLLEQKFFDDEELLVEKNNMNHMILYKEVMMSQIIIKNGWNINCILPKYRNLDYREVKTNINPSGCDPYYRGAYFGGTIQPEEVVFYKSYRLHD